MEQFTANKKPLFDSDIDPKRIKSVADGLRRQGEFESARMLDAYADLLEAREKAEPYGYVSGSPIRENAGSLIVSIPEADFKTPVYTHPAPSDAERLAESYYIGWCRYKTHDGRATTLHLCDSDDEGAFRIYRHAHSAQAQPPAASATVDAVMRVIDGQRRLPYRSIDEKQAFRNALEVALAAQENPNG